MRQGLWNGRFLILAVALLSAGAAALAGFIAPPAYRASIALNGEPDLASYWRTVPWSDVEAAVGSGSERDGGLLASLRDLPSSFASGRVPVSQGGRPRYGIEPGGDRDLMIWADAASPELAGQMAERVADFVQARESERALPAAPTLPQAAAPIAPVEQAGARRALESRIAEARARLAAAEARRTEFESRIAGAGRSAAELERALRVATDGADVLRRQTAEGERAARELDAGRAQGGEAFAASIEGWPQLARLAAQRASLAASVDDLSKTLLEAHPRMAMARLRLQDMDEQLSQDRGLVRREVGRRIERLRTQLATATTDAEALKRQLDERRTLDAERAEASQQVRVETRVLEELQAALEAEDGPSEPPASMSSPIPVAPVAVERRLERHTLPVKEVRPTIWPLVTGSALLGALASSAFLAAAALRPGGRRHSLAPPMPRQERPGTVEPPSIREAAPALVAGIEVAAVDDVIDAIIASGMSRAVLVSPSKPDRRPIGVDIVRRLALRGQSVALVDLSEDQAAAKAMGASADTRGIADLIEGDTTYAEIARHDFATKADIVPSGRRRDGSRLDTDLERRNVLDFIERSYETLLVDCSGMEPRRIGDLMDEEAALLVTVTGIEHAEVLTFVEALREAGLRDVILVSEARSFL